MKKTYVDPPEGYKYGFPKFYIGEKPVNLNQWLTANGYPAQLIIDYGDQFPVRTWESGLTAEEVYDDFFDTNERYIEYSKEESFCLNDKLFIYTPPANDRWIVVVLKRALEMNKKYKGSYLTIPKKDYIVIDVAGCH